MIDWSDPAARFRLLERVGHDEYHRLQAEARAASVIETVEGHDLIPVSTRFGRLIQVGSTGNAYKDIADARRYAEANPVHPMVQSGL